MPFFSKRLAIAAGATVRIMEFPSNVRLASLAIKAEGGDILIAPSAAPAETGMTFTDGSGVSFSAAELALITRESKVLYAYSTAGADVELFGIMEY